jgi:hypothetical protein
MSEEELIQALQTILDKPDSIHGTVRKGTKEDDNPNHQCDTRPRLVFDLECCPRKFGVREMMVKMELWKYRVIFRFSVPNCQYSSDLCCREDD